MSAGLWHVASALCSGFRRTGSNPGERYPSATLVKHHLTFYFFHIILIKGFSKKAGLFRNEIKQTVY